MCSETKNKSKNKGDNEQTVTVTIISFVWKSMNMMIDFCLKFFNDYYLCMYKIKDSSMSFKLRKKKKKP